MNPDLDLSLERFVRAPRSVVWRSWTDPDRLARWWLPSPTRCLERLDVAPGGEFVTSMSDDGVEFRPHLDACFLAVTDGERLAFTNAVNSRWRPTTPDLVAMTAVITMLDHPDGTDYRILVKHRDTASRARHGALGFADGWGAVTTQLAAVAEREGDVR